MLFEGLAASGLRSIRYALEVKGIEEIIASDISCEAYQLMSRNIEDNQVSHLVKPLQIDARYFKSTKILGLLVKVSIYQTITKQKHHSPNG